MNYARIRWAGRLVMGLLVGTLVLNVAIATRDCADLRPVGLGQIAPAAILWKIDSSGQVSERFALESTRGSVVLLDFWATWCAPCRQSMPIVEELAREYRDRGVVVVSVNTEGPGHAKAAREVVDENGPSDVILAADDGGAASLFKVTTIPHMLVIDRDGVVRLVQRGFSSPPALRGDLVQAIEPLL